MTDAAAATPGGPARRLTLERERGLRQRLVARDERALAELIDSTTPWLLGVAQWMLGDSQEAEDVVQDVFVRLWQQDLSGRPATVESFRGCSGSRARVASIGCAAGGVEKQYEATLTGPGADSAITPPHEPNEAATPGWHVHRGIHEALATLPPEQQRVVHLAYFMGLTQSEVAEQLKVPLGTVKTRTRLAFAQLRTLLAPMKEWLT